MPRGEVQKLRMFYIADLLMTETDEDYNKDDEDKHGILISQIQGHLREKGIFTGEHAITRDIKMLRDHFKMDIKGGKGKPFYLASRYIRFDQLSVIAECIGAAKFISKSDSDELIRLLSKFCSKYQADTISTDYFVTGRPRRTQQSILDNLKTARKAIAGNYKICFKYRRRTISNPENPVFRRNGKIYTVSPFEVVLSEGNHYLIGYDNTRKKVSAFRFDRMETIKPLSFSPCEGKEEFTQMNIKDYARQTFGMFIGENKAHPITILFHSSLLDAIYERFGNDEIVEYKKIDDDHFSMTADIVASEQFYGWVCGFGEKAVIQGPEEVVDEFKEFIEKLRIQYL